MILQQVCPSCGEDVCVGTAGPVGLAGHEGKGHVVKQKPAKKTRTLFDVDLKKAPG